MGGKDTTFPHSRIAEGLNYWAEAFGFASVDDGKFLHVLNSMLRSGH